MLSWQKFVGKKCWVRATRLKAGVLMRFYGRTTLRALLECRWKEQQLPTAAPPASQQHLRSRHPGVYPTSQSPVAPGNLWSALHLAQLPSRPHATTVLCDFATCPGSFAALAVRKVLAAPATPG